MINKNTTAPVYSSVFAMNYSTPMLFMFVCLWVAFCLALTWRRYQQDELHRKYPISSVDAAEEETSNFGSRRRFDSEETRMRRGEFMLKA
jgi:hypothetical protein